MSELAAASEPRSGPRGVVLLAMFFFLAQLGLLFLLGTKAKNSPRSVVNVPHLQLADGANEFISLNDPTLFALPHANDFSTRLWLPVPQLDEPDFRWREEPRWLALDMHGLGAALKNYLQTNAAAETPLVFKSAPEWEFSAVVPQVFLPTNSTVRLAAGLENRPLISPLAPPVLFWNDVPASSRVQLLVGPDGFVMSAVMLESSGFELADQTALRLANAAQFAPAPQLQFGEMIFTWQTTSTNNGTNPR